MTWPTRPLPDTTFPQPELCEGSELKVLGSSNLTCSQNLLQLQGVSLRGPEKGRGGTQLLVSP